MLDISTQLLHVATIAFDWYPHTRVQGLVEAARNAGHTIDVICLSQPGKNRYDVDQGITVYRLPMSRSYGYAQPFAITVLSWCWFLLLAGAVVTWLHLKRRYDVIHVHNMPDFLVFSTLFPKLLGAKIILDVQDVSPELMSVKVKQPLLRRILIRLAIWQERISIAFAHHVVTVGWPFEELLLQRGVPKENLTIIRNSANPEHFPVSRRSLPRFDFTDKSRPFILMYHGTVTERHGLDTAIRALALAHRIVPQVQLKIKGTGDPLPLKKLVEDLGISDLVVLSGPCPIGEVVDFVEHGDVGIIPYHSDAFMDLLLPTKAYEFAWMYRPMIASNTPGIRSMFRPESIMLCDPASPESFAEAIIDLYQHPEKCASLVANAAADYMPYQWEMEANRYQRLLVSLWVRSTHKNSIK